MFAIDQRPRSGSQYRLSRAIDCLDSLDSMIDDDPLYDGSLAEFSAPMEERKRSEGQP